MTDKSSETEQDTYRWNLLQKKALEVRSVRAVEIFRAAGIEPIVIKGAAAAQFYPKEKARTAVDIDLAVSDADFEKADELRYTDAANKMVIDLHRELRYLDEVSWEDLFKNSKLLDVGEDTIRVLRPEDNLRVLCVHWLNDGGVYEEKLWDIYYAVSNRPADFDWDRFLNIVSERRRRWLVCTLGLAERYLGLDLSNTPVKEEARKLPKWLIKTIEKEWARDIKPIPLHSSLHDAKFLIEQVKLRLSPNPIRATVEMEGSFDARTRFFYKLGNFAMRILPSCRRVSTVLRAR